MFTTHIEGGSLIYHTANSLVLPGVTHAFTTRAGGVSHGIFSSLNLGTHRGDSSENVMRNYKIICFAIGVDETRTVFSRQVHRDDVKIVTEQDAGTGLTREADYEADALITNVPELPLVVFSADCIPVLLYDPITRSIGAAHSGWRGTALGIAAKTARSMYNAYGARPENIIAAIGPGIGRCCFETNSDVPDAMRAAIGDAAEDYIEPVGEKWHVDLKGIIAHWLRLSGVTNISISDECTHCDPQLYWSHRITGNERGSQAALIALK